jgi:hypothetical protein
VSNKAAISLYRDQLGYVCDRTVSRYYHDGEDAHLMVRTGLQDQLESMPAEQRQEMKRQNGLSDASTVASLSVVEAVWSDHSTLSATARAEIAGCGGGADVTTGTTVKLPTHRPTPRDSTPLLLRPGEGATSERSSAT